MRYVAASMVTDTHTHTQTQTHTDTDTHNDYRNPHGACAEG